MPERCVDASVAIKWIVKSETWRKKARRFLLESLQNSYTLIAPPLFAYETESVLQGRLQAKTMTVAAVDEALTRLATWIPACAGMTEDLIFAEMLRAQHSG